MPLISVKDLLVQKNQTTICAVPALTVEAGEVVAIIGSNGSGKTTLLRVLAGLQRSYSGMCELKADPRDTVFVHQSPYLFRGSVLGNVSYGLRVRGRGRAECERVGRQWLARCGAAPLAHKAAAHLSGGERKRVALARALAVKPRLLLLDEPLEEVDQAGTETVCQLIKACAAETTILVTSPTATPEGLAARQVRLG